MVINGYCLIILIIVEPCHWVCKPAYLVPVPSLDKLEGLRQNGHPALKWGVREVGRWLVRMEQISSGTGSPG